jgi:hypothetical protein
MSATSERWWGLILAVSFAAAIAVPSVLIGPLRAGQVGFDSAASVLYFDRIASGTSLEAPLTATPKPLLTIVFGLLHAVTGDWRAISLATILASAVAVVLAMILTRRLAGRSAAVFSGVALVAAVPLIADVALSYAIAWALLGWLGAGLFLTLRPPRYALAGMALGIASLARIETLILLALATFVLLLGLLPAARRWIRPPPAAAGILLGWLALPIQAAHDVLLVGDPLYSLTTSARASEGAPLIGVLGALEMLIGRYFALGPLVVLGILGLVVLARARRWALLLGLGGLSLGVAGSIILLAARDTYVSARYLIPIDLALLFAAGAGYSALRVSLPEMSRRSRERWRAPVAIALAAAIGLAITLTFTAVEPRWLLTIRSNLRLHENAETLVPTIRAGVAPGLDGAPAVLVPVLLGPQMVIDLDLPIPSVSSTDGRGLDGSGDGFHIGQLVYHDRWGDRAYPALAALEVEEPVTIGPYTFAPLESDPIRGYWLLEVREAER